MLHKYLFESREFKVERDERLKHSLLWELQRINKTANELSDGDGMIRWFEAANEIRTAVGGVPKDLDKRIYSDLWSRRIPSMLTSGTLSVGGDFSAFKQSIGLNNKNIRLSEAAYSSPFNYMDNCLLYLTKNVPDYRANSYIAALTDEIEQLITASNGHAAVLFTSDDTCVVAVCDIRAAEGESYHESIIAALPKCRVTDSIDDVIRFYLAVKPLRYFVNI